MGQWVSQTTGDAFQWHPVRSSATRCCPVTPDAVQWRPVRSSAKELRHRWVWVKWRWWFQDTSDDIKKGHLFLSGWPRNTEQIYSQTLISNRLQRSYGGLCCSKGFTIRKKIHSYLIALFLPSWICVIDKDYLDHPWTVLMFYKIIV